VALKQQLEAELAKRRRRNPRYSLRAFARDLATNHMSLSQILRGRREVSVRMTHQLTGKPARSLQQPCDSVM